MDINLRQKLTDIALKQIEAGVNYKKPRLSDIQKSEDLYLNKIKKQLKNRFNIPIPIMGGFVDTLLSKIDDSPTITFEPNAEENLIESKKITALWNQESGDDESNWSFHDRQAKKMAIFSGRGIYKFVAESDPEYKSHMLAVDYYDYYNEPNGGAILKNHIFQGQENIMKSKHDLETGIKDGRYDPLYTRRILMAGDELVNQKTTKDVNNRRTSLGLNVGTNNYIGDEMFNLTEHYMRYNGDYYYLLIDQFSRQAIRVEKLKDVIKSGDAPYESWATHEDLTNFWSKAPVDDIRPMADALTVLINQGLDNVQKRNWGMRAYDKNIFDNPKMLEWRPDGLIPADSKDGNIQNGLYQIQTPDTGSLTLNMVSFFDSFIGQKTGVTPSTQGVTDKDKKVGIFFGELEQVADRLGLLNKSYKEVWANLGKKYVAGLQEHLNQKQAIQIIGSDGLEWTEVSKSDINNKFKIKVSGGNAELAKNEIKKQKREKAIIDLLNAGIQLNQEWVTENILRNGEYEEDEIRRAMDMNNNVTEDIASEAMKAVMSIIKGKEVKLNKEATTGFMSKIVNEAMKGNYEPIVFDKLIAYAMAHKNIARFNGMRKQASAIEIGDNVNEQLKGQTEPPQGGVQGQPRVAGQGAGMGAGVPQPNVGRQPVQSPSNTNSAIPVQAGVNPNQQTAPI